MSEDQDEEVIDIGKRIASSLSEIGRHLAASTDWEVYEPRRLAKRYFIKRYTDQHPDAFERNGRLDYVYTGDNPKPGLPSEDEDDDTEGGDDEDEATEDGVDGDEDDESEDKLTFSMSEAPETDL